ncbi:MAG: hypothetical protein ACM37W_17815 [Actinomycetota bacterium]
MLQQFGRILEQVLLQTWKYVNSRAFLQLVLTRAASYYDSNQSQINEQIKQTWTSITSIRVKIDSRKKEVEFIAETIKVYRTGNVEKSTVALGENITIINNNISLCLYLNESSIKEFFDADFAKKINEESIKLAHCLELKNKDDLDDIKKVKTIIEVKEIDNRIDTYGKDIERVISQVTNYEQLQKALQTS